MKTPHSVRDELHCILLSTSYNYEEHIFLAAKITVQKFCCMSATMNVTPRCKRDPVKVTPGLPKLV